MVYLFQEGNFGDESLSLLLIIEARLEQGLDCSDGPALLVVAFEHLAKRSYSL